MKVNLSELNSGLKYITCHSSSVQSVVLLTLFGVGSRHESSAQSGIAHLLEHMMGKATTAYPESRSISFAIEMLGGEYNAFTGREYTGYYIKIPKNNALQAVELLSQIICESQLYEQDLSVEKEIIAEEINMYLDQPKSLVHNAFYKSLFEGNQLGEEILGTSDSLAKITIADLQEFKQNNYTQDNMVFALAGNLTDIDAAQYAEKFSGLNKMQNKVAQQSIATANVAKSLVTVKKPSEQMHLVIGGYGPDRSYEEYDFALGEIMLGQGIGSLLFNRVREELGAAYYIGAASAKYSDTGVYQIRAGVDKSKIEQVIDESLKCIDIMKGGKMDPNHFIRAKNLMLAGFANDLETAEDIAYWYAFRLLLLSKFTTIEDEIKKIHTTSLHKVVEQTNKYYTSQNIMLCLIDNDEIVKSFKYS